MRLHRLRRGIAVFLVAFAFFDMGIVDVFFPQLCGDEQAPQSINNPVESTDRSSGKTVDNSMAVSNHDSQPDQDSHQSSSDEDCFCCCPHIIPGVQVDVATLNFPPRLDDPAIPSLPSSSPRGVFHPPRHS
jgi:hypothetical protein